MGLKLSIGRMRRSAGGFTVLELLVSTLVFGVALMAVTTGILQFSRVYYKGVSETITQDTARNIVDIVAQGIQFSGGNVTPAYPVAQPESPNNLHSFCIGNQQFSYTIGYQLSDNPIPADYQSRHVLVVDGTVAQCTQSTAPQNLFTANIANIKGRELMVPGTRLAKLEVVPLPPNMWRVSVRVLFADRDLVKKLLYRDATCLDQRAGTQFCAMSEITTTVVKRVQ